MSTQSTVPMLTPASNSNCQNQNLVLPGTGTDFIPVQVYCRLAPLRSGPTAGRSNTLPVTLPYSIEKEAVDHESGKFSKSPRCILTLCDDVTGAWAQATLNQPDIFYPDTPQEEIYAAIAHPLVASVKEGYNAVLLAYGQTSSGKTHTMIGPNGGDARFVRNHPDRGIVPRVVEELLGNTSTSSSARSVEVSYLEIYNEVATDLIAKLRGARTFTFKGTERNRIERQLIRVRCAEVEECMSLLEEVSTLRRTGSTDANLVSSRSHVIIQIRPLVTQGAGGKLSLVDLAGSESIKKSHATVDAGAYPSSPFSTALGIPAPLPPTSPSGFSSYTRMSETRNINTSLLALKKVIHSLYRQTDHVPYKDSILTAVLEDSLGGTAVTALLVTCSSTPGDLNESISTLRFAAEASWIRCRPRKVPPSPFPFLPTNTKQSLTPGPALLPSLPSTPRSSSSVTTTTTHSGTTARTVGTTRSVHSRARSASQPRTGGRIRSAHRTKSPTGTGSDAVSMEIDSSRKMRDHEELVRTNESLERSISNLRKENEMLRMQCERTLTEERVSFQKRLASLHAEIEAILSSVQRVRSDNEMLRSERAQQEQTIRVLQSEVVEHQRLKEEVASLRTEVNLLRSMNSSLGTQLSTTQTELYRGTEDAAKLEEQCEHLAQEYAAMVDVVHDATRGVRLLENQLKEEREAATAARENCERLRSDLQSLQLIHEHLLVEQQRNREQRWRKEENKVGTEIQVLPSAPLSVEQTNWQ